MKATLIALLGLSTSGAWAQAATAKQQMGIAMQELSRCENLQLILEGTERTGNAEVKLDASLFLRNWIDGNRRMTQLDLQTYRSNQLQSRIAADGTSLWLWKPLKNEYGCLTYGSHEGFQPEKYVQNLFRLLDVEARGIAALPAKLISQAFKGLGSGSLLPVDQIWTPWPAMAEVTLNGDTVVCEWGSPVTQQVQFHLEDLGEGRFRLVSVDYWELVKLGTKDRETTWIMTIERPSQPIPSQTFVFLPPKNARSVSLPARTGGL